MLRKAKTRGPFSLSLSSPLVPARVKGAKDRQRLTEKREECVGHVCMYGNACVRVCNREREREKVWTCFRGIKSVWIMLCTVFGYFVCSGLARQRQRERLCFQAQQKKGK